MNKLFPHSYRYKPKATTTLICILFFGLCTAVLGVKAASNDRGLILNGILTFSEQGASIFYWILTALSFGFVVIGLLVIIQRATGTLNLELSENELKIPSGFFKKTMTQVSLSDVTGISELEVHGQKFLYLHTAERKFCVSRALMPSKQSYEEIKELIQSIVGIANEKNF